MIEFPKIGQFRQAITEVKLRTTYVGRDELGNPIYDGSKADYPTLDYVGTVKLHGTNASVVQHEMGGELITQSRQRVITPEDDNAGFSRFVFDEDGVDRWSRFFNAIRMFFGIAPNTTLTVYGEWCGGNIQKGVGIANVDKMFVIFAIRLHQDEDTIWLSPEQLRSLPNFSSINGVKNIFDFPNYELSIDFKEPRFFQNTLVNLTEKVEEECPVAKALGATGTGEGIVWRCTTPGYEDSRFWFKVKGTKHSVTKVKTLASVDTVKLNSIREFVDATVTEARLEQGLDYLREMGKDISRKSTGDYIRWLVNDIMSEESDTMEASGLTSKEANPKISAKARAWFFKKLDDDLGI